MHGGHANMWRDSITLRWNYHLLASPGYVVLLTDYRGSTGYGEQFTLDILGDPLRGPADDINQARGRGHQALPVHRRRRGRRRRGASYGGHLANWLEATTDALQVPGQPRRPVQPPDAVGHQRQHPPPRADDGRALLGEGARPGSTRARSRTREDFKTPMLLSVGENDFRVPMNNTLEMYAVLQRMRVPARLLVWPDENHWILKGENSRVFYREVHDWLARWLK